MTAPTGVSFVAMNLHAYFAGVYRTSRLVWVSATLYRDGVRRRCATRCPRPLVDLLATQCPRLRRLSGGAVALEQASAWSSTFGTLPAAVLAFAVGGRPPTPPDARFARKAVVAPCAKPWWLRAKLGWLRTASRLHPALLRGVQAGVRVAKALRMRAMTAAGFWKRSRQVKWTTL